LNARVRNFCRVQERAPRGVRRAKEGGQSDFFADEVLRRFDVLVAKGNDGNRKGVVPIADIDYGHSLSARSNNLVASVDGEIGLIRADESDDVEFKTPIVIHANAFLRKIPL